MSLRKGIFFGIVGLLAATTTAAAQAPSAGSTGMKYQIVGPSTSPLSAPIPTTGVPTQPKQSFFGRFYDTLAKYLPFVPAKKPAIAPQMPTTSKLPNQGPGVTIQNTGQGIPIPQLPPLIQGSAR